MNRLHPLAFVCCIVISFFVQGNEDSLKELTLEHTQSLLLSGQTNLQTLSDYYLRRIERLDQGETNLNAIAIINLDLQQQILALQKKIDNKQPLGSLFGAFVVVKDNIDVKGMPNTAGSWLMREHMPEEDAFLIQRLKQQDAIILGKTNLSEWANFRSEQSSSGWSSLHGQTKNPYNTAYSPCGSSSGSGTAVAADLALFAVGTETDGSVTCPAAVTGIVGIKPTLGLISRSGIIPISHSQDTAGPMARNVTDAVRLLEAMQGQDNADNASLAPLSFKDALAMGKLKGKRIGIIRNAMGYHQAMDTIFEEQAALLKKAGVTLVNVEIDTLDKLGDDEYLVLLAEFKHDLNHYLKTSGAPLTSLEQAITLNKRHNAITMPIFDQNIFEKSLAAPLLSDESYLTARKNNLLNTRKSGIDKVMKEKQLALLIAPTTGPAWKINHEDGDEFLGSVSSAPAIAGYPHVTVPMGYVNGLPVGMSFIGGYLDDKVVIQAAYEYEQLSNNRKPPVID